MATLESGQDSPVILKSLTAPASGILTANLVFRVTLPPDFWLGAHAGRRAASMRSFLAHLDETDGMNEEFSASNRLWHCVCGGVEKSFLLTKKYMIPKTMIQPESPDERLEVVVGVFPHTEDSNRVAASLRGPGIRLQRVSIEDPAVPGKMPEMFFDDAEEVEISEVTKGMVTGASIGVGAGLLVGIPTGALGLAVLAPLTGFLAGAWIGGVDEAERGIELPNRTDYQQLLEDGKSIVLIAGDEETRIKYGQQMAELGAEKVHQHPPVKQLIRQSA
jgi:hypothetical protein